MATSGPTTHVKPDNPCQAIPSSPTIHVKPSRQAQQSTSSPTIHVRPDHPRPARQTREAIPSSPTTHAKPFRPARQSTSGPTTHVRPGNPCEAIPSGPNVQAKPFRQPLTQHLAHGHVRRCAPIAQTAMPSICYTSRPRKKDLDHAVPSIERTRYVLLRL